MLKPLNKESAFAAIAEDLELPIVLLSSPDPRLRLAMLDKIGAALLGTNLTWRDLAERVTAPRLTIVEPVLSLPPAPPTASFPPASEIKIAPGALLSNEELQSFGYRSRGRGYGYEGTPIPGVEAPQLRER